MSFKGCVKLVADIWLLAGMADEDNKKGKTDSQASNDLKFANAMTVKMQMDGTPEDKWPDKCIGCGACAAVCPQHIDIPGASRRPLC